MGVGVLGPLEVDDGNVRLGARDRIVLAALAMRGEVLSPEQLADAVWADAVPPTWNKALQGCVSRLRKTLGREAIQTSPHGYRLMLPRDAVDAWRFEQLVARARELLTLREPERAGFMIGEALALWRGRPLAELEEWEPGVVEAARLLELRLDAEELHLDAALQAGRHREVLATAQSMVESAPLRERRWTMLALAQYQSGRQAEALRTLHRLKVVLAENLGLDPAPEAVALEQAILRQDPSLAVEAAPAGSTVSCPYLGLTPYDEGDADSFFGRDQEVAECLRRLADHGALVVVGPSGSGKSSLVRAGIAVALRRQGRPVVVVQPGRRPADAIAEPLANPHPPVLVIDQAEEVFSLCDDAEERERFLRSLVAYAEHTPVVLALRADRTGDVSAHPQFARLLERGLFLLGAMTPENLQAAVERPARQAGLVVEPGLVDLLVREVEGEPGALPLLSHVLRETWLRREGRTLTVAGYQASGGIRGAVAQSAESVYAGVPEDQRHMLKDVLLRLVAPGPAGEPVRARMPRRMVVADPAHDPLVDRLVAARLVTSDDGVVELAHESLAQAWPRLRGWLDDDVEGRRILHHLVAAADAWNALGRPDSELYRGVRLTQTLAWHDAARPELTPVEREFLAAGRDAADAEARAAAERARQQTSMIRRLRLTLGGAAVLLVLAIVAGVLAVRQADRANESATAAAARLLGARALTTQDITVSMLLAAAGHRLEPSVHTRANLFAALALRPELIGSAHTGGWHLGRMDGSPDGRYLVVQDLTSGVWRYDTVKGSFDRVLQHPTQLERWAQAGWPVAHHPTRRLVAVGLQAFDRLPVRLLGAARLSTAKVQLGGLPKRPARAVDIVFSGNGRYLAASFQQWRTVPRAEASPDAAMVLVWKLASPGRPVLRVPLEAPEVSQYVALSDDGRTLYTSLPLRAYDVPSGRVVAESGRGYWFAMDLHPRRELLAVPGSDNDVVLVDGSTLEVVRRLAGPLGAVKEVRFSHDGRLLAASSSDRSVIVWDTRSGQRRQVLQAGDDAVHGLAFSSDDRLLHTAGRSGVLRTWDLGGARRFIARIDSLPRVTIGRFSIGEAVLSPRADAVAYLSHGFLGHETSTLRLLDLGSRTASPPIPVNAPLAGVAWHPDGSMLVTADRHGLATLWDSRTEVDERVVLARQTGHDDVVGVDYTSDGTGIVVAGRSGVVRRFDGATLRPSGEPVDLGTTICCVAAAGNGMAVVVVAGHGPSDFINPTPAWALVDLDEGTVVRQEELPLTQARVLQVSPDGGRLAVGGRSGGLLLIDLRSGAPVRSTLAAHEAPVLSVRFSRDGDQLVSTGADGTVQLYHGRSAEPLASARLATPDLATAAFGGRSDEVLLSTLHTGVHRWPTDSRSALDFACRVAGRDLTPQEWTENLGDRPFEETCPAG